MALNPNVGEALTVTIAHYSKDIADNVTNNTALLSRLRAQDRVKTFSGGNTIRESLEYDGNTTFGWYTGFDPLNVEPSQTLDSADFDMKLCSVSITISGEESLKNRGKAQMHDLMMARVGNAERTLVNRMSEAIYGDGTGDGGKRIGGLQQLVVTAPQVGVVGGINRATRPMWRNQVVSGVTSENIKQKMMELWIKTCRNSDKVELIPSDDVFYRYYWSALQDQQRFSSPRMARMGFMSLKFNTADVILDGGLDGSCPASTMFFLNTKYLKLRPHKDRNFAPIGGERESYNQDAIVRLIGWAGNMTITNSQLQGRLSA